MRGAPQVGFSATIRKIKVRISLLTRFRPSTCLTLEIHDQYRRNRAMPVHDGSRSDQDKWLPPPGPECPQRTPEQLVQGSQSTARSLGVQSQQLPTERSSVGSRSALGAPTQSSESRTAPPSLHPTGLVGVGSDNEHRNQVLARYG